ncbi:MAG: cysteine--tRNA ligase, partial [Candidatus Aenigmarchaeota archaeon]|nr:cysteine--tRNA ligase [Candidatus Aenigmarchaeota archaeon]
MVLRFYNTLTRKKDEFIPVKKGTASIYTCGPTVYSFAHIGNLRAFLFYDILRRYLKYRGFSVKHVMNITDVDDKTIRDSRKEGITLRKFTERYTKLFFEDLKTLNVETFEFYPKATDHIKDMVKLIRTLMDKGFAYMGDDQSIYFNVKKFKDYGKLSKIDLSRLKSGARVAQDEYTKEQVQDFALWKAWAPEDGDVYWETELGKGRPGWHIECSVMSTKYLGKTIDIHGGGVDLIFPHHENEIAQSEAATGKPFVRYWLHNEHILVEGKKMSKSLGNFFTLRDLIKREHDPMAIRFSLISAHYRSKLNITDKALWDAKQALERIHNFMDLLREAKGRENPSVAKLIKKAKKEFEEAMDDDLDTNTAIASMFEFIKEVNKLIDSGKIGKKDAESAIKLIKRFDTVLGVLGEKDVSPDLIAGVFGVALRVHKDLSTRDQQAARKLDYEIKRMKSFEPDIKLMDQLVTMIADVREDLRRKKEYNLSDMIRSELAGM